MIEQRACRGGETEPCRLIDMGHAQKCLSCGSRVRDDLVDHKFFGFAAGCPKAVGTSSSKLAARRSDCQAEMSFTAQLLSGTLAETVKEREREPGLYPTEPQPDAQASRRAGCLSNL